MVKLKHVFDFFVINLPNGVTIGVLTLSDLKELSGIILAVVSAVCTILLTRHKLKKNKED